MVIRWIQGRRGVAVRRFSHLGTGAGLWTAIRGRGVAGCLIALQLAEAAIDGALDAGFVAGELHEGVGALAIDAEGAGQEIAFAGGDGGRRRGIAGLLSLFHVRGVL
ncbi:MAG TPA: hypothetical protein VMG35_02265 [Bryobacteraceae bacterium]|nr:hypothetical protein [Bryobacteraceae bacterium]